MTYKAIFQLCNFGGLAIVSIDVDGTCYSVFDFGDGPKNGRRTRIYDDGPRPYIRRYNRRYYLDQFIKTGV